MPRLPERAYTERRWRIHEIAYDFRLVDVWALPTPGGPDDFPRLVRLLTSFDPAASSSVPTRTLFAIRRKLGELLHLDDEETGVGARVTSLRERMPPDLRDLPPGPTGAMPFSPLYTTEEEFAAEIANRTVHGVIHLAWVPDPEADGSFRGQMAILVKPNGLIGTAYLAAIMPFRHLIVYPALMRELGSRWRADVASGAEA